MIFLDTNVFVILNHTYIYEPDGSFVVFYYDFGRSLSQCDEHYLMQYFVFCKLLI